MLSSALHESVSDCFRYSSPLGLTLRQKSGMACLVFLCFRAAFGNLGNVQCEVFSELSYECVGFGGVWSKHVLF